jgi:ABC-type nitrate/sulfonate/bicarbonate transport system ATPase subunit
LPESILGEANRIIDAVNGERIWKEAAQELGIAAADIPSNPSRGVERISLIGHSGCGKSTLLNMIAGLDLPTGGVVMLDGMTVREPGPDRMVVFQNYSLLPWLTVRDNVALAVDEVLTERSAQERKELVEHYINIVGLTSSIDKLPLEISGGMRQRVAIARAFSLRPKILVLDEPFGALDAITKEEMQEELSQICADHTCTHWLAIGWVVSPGNWVRYVMTRQKLYAL